MCFHGVRGAGEKWPRAPSLTVWSVLEASIPSATHFFDLVVFMIFEVQAEYCLLLGAVAYVVAAISELKTPH